MSRRKKKKKNNYYKSSIPKKDVHKLVFSKRAIKAAWKKQRKVLAYFDTYGDAYQQAKDAINDEVLYGKRTSTPNKTFFHYQKAKRKLGENFQDSMKIKQDK